MGCTHSGANTAGGGGAVALSVTKNGLPLNKPTNRRASQRHTSSTVTDFTHPGDDSDRVFRSELLGAMSNKACFGAGSYWGTEKFISEVFGKRAFGGKILNGQVGFMGPSSAPANPTYEEVCRGDTGHIEVFDFEFNGGAAYYEALVRFFFQFHDPTTRRRQGNDVGKQFSSVIYCYDQEQLRIAKKVRSELQSLVDVCAVVDGAYEGDLVLTEVHRSTEFYPGPPEHQHYLKCHPDGYCNHYIRYHEWPGAALHIKKHQQSRAPTYSLTSSLWS